MMALPKFFRRVFTAIYALITATFVCTVAYAATFGAFGEKTPVALDSDAEDCHRQLKSLETTLTQTALEHLQPYRTQRLSEWSKASKNWRHSFNQSKGICTSSEEKRHLRALASLHQAYSNSILGFERRSRASVSTLEAMKSDQQGK